MKTRTLRLLTLLTFLTFFLYDCKDKEADSLEPANTELSNQLDKLELAPTTLQETPDIKLVPGKVEPSAKTLELNNSLGSVTSASIPASVTKAAEEVSTTLSEAEIKALNEVSPSGASKTVLNSQQVRAILSKASGDVKLQGYLSLLTVAKVNGLLDGGRTGAATEGTVTGPAIEAGNTDDCIARANEKFDKTKERLDEAKAREQQKINEAYTRDLERIQRNLEQCTGENSAEHFEALRQVGIKIANEALAALEKAKPFLRPGQYEYLKALINIQLLDYLDKVNQLEAAKIGTCTEIAAIAKTRAEEVKNSNTAAVEASYNDALAKAIELRDKMIENCHNQGSGI
ncbi:hypothetical protein GCM10010967_53320 [Dyadobacter beijingensis]|uniref:Uncharacterized protein n=1 Tax=Dyadobacter beijingensis TaxID=365489 RepID=A0ABQ2IGU6_9BACT|nr:hypothetical protein [Dyadobacter beijingensis]GGN10819.1 hypothetical protein GCM10010967_53320 [Dyadobacter beijingensis]